MVGPGGGPEHLTVLMAGESLFNDATSIVLFEVRCVMHSTLDTGCPLWHHFKMRSIYCRHDSNPVQ